METDEFLAHYGIKGMQWGQRKSNSKAGLETMDMLRREKSQREKMFTKKEIRKQKVRIGVTAAAVAFVVAAFPLSMPHVVRAEAFAIRKGADFVKNRLA